MSAANNVIALDTSTEVLAISAARTEAWVSLTLKQGLQHSPSLLPLADQLLGKLGLAAADLDLVICSLGPGSFTGIRIGLATSLGIAGARGIPVVGISTLDALAEPWKWHTGEVYPVIDARKGRIYTAAFSGGERQTDYMDLTPAVLAQRLGSARHPLMAGPDAEKVKLLLGMQAQGLPCVGLLDPGAYLRLGKAKYEKEGADALPLRPLYLRKSEAEIARGE